ncbi:hypothetical protein SORBI_3008G092532 [Sorghum bicolor]|uniref:Uncharacterized protein n=1 Tax=Sorghum bicolor TaxID=4558 RepID=A0A1Z5R5S9_SORBI|nr:hypothetical protein SORBI_3008G092532 [Sorghum bicolor]
MMFENTPCVYLSNLLKERFRLARSLERWFPSTMVQWGFNKLLNDISTDLVNLFPCKSIWARFDRLPMDS